MRQHNIPTMNFGEKPKESVSGKDTEPEIRETVLEGGFKKATKKRKDNPGSSSRTDHVWYPLC